MTKTTMFKLLGPKGTISTAKFSDFTDTPETGRAMAERHIQCQKDGWEATIFAGENLRIVEE